jgi:pimeloyl-ACP methyl ester carboxylesterase
MDEQVLYLDGLPIRYLVAGSGVPVVLLHGAGGSAAEAAVMHLRHSHLKVIPACGHLPHIERYERFAQVLLGFLDSQVHRIRQSAPR